MLAPHLARVHGPNDHAPVPLQTWKLLLEAYRRPRDYGDKEHRHQTDNSAVSVSPQKVNGVPVGLMFYKGARRLRGSSVLIPGLQDGSPDRVVEGYPGIARHGSWWGDSATRERPDSIRQTPGCRRARESFELSPKAGRRPYTASKSRPSGPRTVREQVLR